jgi:hypothetical protein
MAVAATLHARAIAIAAVTLLGAVAAVTAVHVAAFVAGEMRAAPTAMMIARKRRFGSRQKREKPNQD